MATGKGGSVNFAKLLEQAQQLNAQVPQPTAVPPIQRGLPQIEELSRKLVHSKPPVVDVSKQRAHYLLAGKGFNSEKLDRELKQLHLKKTFEPLEPLGETDVDSYLQHHHDMIILAAMEEAKHETISKFQDSTLRFMQQEWEESKKLMLDALANKLGSWSATPQQPAAASRTNLSLLSSPVAAAATPMKTNTPGFSTVSSVRSRAVTGALFSPASSLGLGTPGAMLTSAVQSRTSLDSKAAQYGHVTVSISESRRNRQPLPVARRFQQCAALIDDRELFKRESMGCWELLSLMVGDDSGVREAMYRTPYLTGDANLQQQLLEGARTCLERVFMKYMEDMIEQNPQAARLGGIPDPLAKIKAFLALQFPHEFPHELEDRLPDGYPSWALIFYCLRCGLLEDAIRVARSASQSHILDFVLPALESLQARRPIADEITKNLAQQSSQHHRRDRVDPYKITVLNLLTRCDRNLPESLNRSIEDFLWFKLGVVALPNVPVPDWLTGHSLPLKTLQQYITNWGPQHFNKDGRTPMLYFQVLLCTQQFERAVEFLLSVDLCIVEAVHFAIALDYYGLLRTQETLSSVKDVQSSGGAFLSLNTIIRNYVRPFAKSDVNLALYYLSLQPERSCVESMSELVLTIQDFDGLLGSVTADGTRKPGVIERLHGPAVANAVMQLVAEESERMGYAMEAVSLYHLAEDYSKVVSLLVAQMSAALTQQSQNREQLRQLASSILTQYQQRGILNQLDPPNLAETFNLLLHLMTVFDLYHEKRYEDALKVLDDLHLVPFDSNPSVMQRMTENFERLDPWLRRIFPEVLVAGMTCLVQLHYATKQRMASERLQGGAFAVDSGKQAYLEGLRHKARSLITFTGLLHYRMPGDTNAQLVKMEVMMM
eukprot:GILJ01004851.1.p1 GENE.GILJ01004851.1~~GILJ01004851.1.p1  ORF type:complete len:905 (+),score=132.16 GILJ01004851.1:60-2717(+)